MGLKEVLNNRAQQDDVFKIQREARLAFAAERKARYNISTTNI